MQRQMSKPKRRESVRPRRKRACVGERTYAKVFKSCSCPPISVIDAVGRTPYSAYAGRPTHQHGGVRAKRFIFFKIGQ